MTLHRLAIVSAVFIGLYLLGSYLILPATWKRYEREPRLAKKTMLTEKRRAYPRRSDQHRVDRQPRGRAARLPCCWLVPRRSDHAAFEHRDRWQRGATPPLSR